jgi:hypothetical protein
MMSVRTAFSSAPRLFLGRRARHPKAAQPQIGGPAKTASDQQIALLIYELLDAHFDTAKLVGRASDGPEWEVHLAYLRDLQRTGRTVLAGLDSGED